MNKIDAKNELGKLTRIEVTNYKLPTRSETKIGRMVKHI
jgi:hypothetical protein